MTARGIFITGTDTGVGKTVIAVGLVRGLLAAGWACDSGAGGADRSPGSADNLRAHEPAPELRIAAMKPVASGSDRTPHGLRNDDALQLMAAANVDTPYETVNPYCFEPAVSPHIAANDAGIQIDLTEIRHRFDVLAALADYVVVEGAGGWLAPISNAATMADLAASLELPILLVVGLRLGCINHAALTKRTIESQGHTFAGWVANNIDPTLARRAENLEALEKVLAQPPLDVVPFREPGSATLEMIAAARRLHTPQYPRIARKLLT